jgi:deoxyribodipyrimidine photo-lyase
VNENRIQQLNDDAPDAGGKYVLYWMQQSQRAHTNPALELAVRIANERHQAVIAGFGLMADYPEANRRHFAFMLEGLAETATSLHKRGIKVVARIGAPDQVALALAEQASVVVCDRGYLRHQRRWRRRVAAKAGKQVIQVEGDTVVPVEAVSDKREYAARTIRPKIDRLRRGYLHTFSETLPRKSSLPLDLTTDVDLRQPDAVLRQLPLDDTVDRSARFVGGTAQARGRLKSFILKHLDGYCDARNDPGAPQCSELSPYLHFGQISPVEIALKIKAAKSGSQKDKAAFLEELIVRRELAVNFTYFESNYDSYTCLPDWAQKTLQKHKKDKRPYRYTRGQMENAKTHDTVWNAAMTEMRRTGYMHNYMRMYWGKKILEWTKTPEYAFSTALYLNNKYFIDGRDPSSYANIAWLFGLHDRAWQERVVFGKVRYMNAAGLKRKFDMDAYVRRINAFEETPEPSEDSR